MIVTGRAAAQAFRMAWIGSKNADPANLNFDPTGNLYNPMIQCSISEFGQQENQRTGLGSSG